MYRKVIVLLALVIAIVVLYYWKRPLGTYAIINGHRLTIELAVTPEEKQLGLGNRKSLPQDQGMLFLYDHKEQYGFWMKGMNFPLDYIWIDGNRVADITENVPVYTNGQLTTLQPDVAVDRILEVNSGTAKRLNIKLNDTIEFIR